MDPILGSIIQTCWTWQMRGWMPCRGQILPVSQYQALFALLGPQFGGDGHSTFALPDLRPWNDAGPDFGKKTRREWHEGELVSHIAVEGIFPSRD